MSPENLFVGFVIIFITSVIGFFWLLRQVWLTQHKILNILSYDIVEGIKQGLEPVVAEIRQVKGSLDTSQLQLQEGLQPFVTEIKQANNALDNSQRQLQDTTSRLQTVGGDFTRSHSYLQDAISTLAEPGTLQNFTHTLTDSIRPLHDIRDGIRDHYDTNAQLQRTISQILQEWREQQAAIGVDFKRIANVIDRWAAEEDLNRREMMSQIMDHLKVVTQQSQAIAHNLRELQGSMSGLAAGSKSLIRTMEGNVESVARLVKLQEALQQEIGENQRLYMNDLKITADALAQNYVQAGIQMNTTLEKSSRILGQYEATIREFHQRHQEVLTRLEVQHKQVLSQYEVTIREFHREHEEVLTRLETQQNQITKEQNKLIEKVHKVVDTLPTRQAQTWQIVLLLLLVLPVLYITYMILSSM